MMTGCTEVESADRGHAVEGHPGAEADAVPAEQQDGAQHERAGGRVLEVELQPPVAPASR